MTSTKSINGSHPVGALDRPSDMELMLYVDGELDDARAKQVAAYIERDANCRRKVAALRLSAEIVREVAIPSAPSAADGLADAVMARIATGGNGAAQSEDAAPEFERDAHQGTVVRPSRPATTTHDGKPANDNGRTIFGLAALAVAAAAGFMIWGRMEPEPIRPTAVAPVVVEQAPAPAKSESEPLPAQAAEAPPVEADSEHGVEVAAVDFGTRIGTIFYVPKEADTSNHTTTVVWLSDDGSGGK